MEHFRKIGNRVRKSSPYDISINDTVQTKENKKEEKLIKQLQEQIHLNARAKGFWNGEAANVPTKLMLIVSEVSEAMEAHRTGNVFGEAGNIEGVNGWTNNRDFINSFEQNVKDTFEDELADCVIRILDLAEGLNINLEEHIKAKVRYNSTRSFRHGGKKY